MRSCSHASRHMRRNWPPKPVRTREGKKTAWENVSSPDKLLMCFPGYSLLIFLQTAETVNTT